MTVQLTHQLTHSVGIASAHQHQSAQYHLLHLHPHRRHCREIAQHRLQIL